MDLQLDEFDSPIGVVLVVSDCCILRAVDFHEYRPRMEQLLKRHYGHITLHQGRKRTDAVARLKDYFLGDLNAIDSLQTATNGTDFQRKVWAALRTIPPGETISYGTLAERIDHPNASRAVGLANGSNPVAIVVPCHRVIGANNQLTGYGGGLARKQWLLNHEKAAAVEQSSVDRATRQKLTRATTLPDPQRSLG
jgi:methylated-DNA-[protein]-cysteine S-methyltransferase